MKKIVCGGLALALVAGGFFAARAGETQIGTAGPGMETNGLQTITETHAGADGSVVTTSVTASDLATCQKLMKQMEANGPTINRQSLTNADGSAVTAATGSWSLTLDMDQAGMNRAGKQMKVKLEAGGKQSLSCTNSIRMAVSSGFAKSAQVLAANPGELPAQTLFRKYLAAAGSAGAAKQAAALGKQLEGLKLTDADLLNEFAWTILTDERLQHRDLALAMRLAKAAVDAAGAEAGSGEEAAAILDTYAHALFDSGKVGAAIKYQKLAVASAAADETKAELDGTLKKYEAAPADGNE